MKKLLKDARNEANTLPKGLWIAAAIVPFGIVTITVYLAGKTLLEKIKNKKLTK